MPLVRRPLATYLVSSKFFLVPVALERILFVFVLVICCHDTHTHLHMQRVQSVVTLFLAGNVCSEVCSHRVHQLSPFMVVFFFFFSPYFFEANVLEHACAFAQV